jgi:hypothetical protein
MTEVLVALVAVVPALLGLLNSRTRQLNVIRSEVEVLNALPKGQKLARAAMRHEIHASVEHYTQRGQRRVESFMTFGLTFGWLALVVGIYLYEGSITDPETVESFRKIGASLLIGGGATVILLALLGNGIKAWFVLRNWRLRRRTRQLSKRLTEQEERVEELQATIALRAAETEELKRRCEQWLAEVLELEQQALAAGKEPVPRPELLEELFIAYESAGTLADYEPSPELVQRLKPQVRPLDD